MDYYIELNTGRSGGVIHTVRRCIAQLYAGTCGSVVHTGGRWIIAQRLIQVHVEV